MTEKGYGKIKEMKFFTLDFVLWWGSLLFHCSGLSFNLLMLKILSFLLPDLQVETSNHFNTNDTNYSNCNSAGILTEKLTYLNTLNYHQAVETGYWPAFLFQVDASKPLQASYSAPQTLQNHEQSNYLINCIFTNGGISEMHPCKQPGMSTKNHLIKTNNYI